MTLAVIYEEYRKKLIKKLADYKTPEKAARFAYNYLREVDNFPSLPLQQFGFSYKTRIKIKPNVPYDSTKAELLLPNPLAYMIIRELALNGDVSRRYLVELFSQRTKSGVPRTTIYDYLHKLGMNGWVFNYRIQTGDIGATPSYWGFEGMGKEFNMMKISPR